MSQVKRICAGLLAIMMLMSFLTVSAFAATPAGMEVTTDGESIDKLKAGDTVTVKFTLPVMDKLAGAQIELGFDKSSFEFQEKTQYDEDLETDVTAEYEHNPSKPWYYLKKSIDTYGFTHDLHTLRLIWVYIQKRPPCLESTAVLFHMLLFAAFKD